MIFNKIYVRIRNMQVKENVMPYFAFVISIHFSFLFFIFMFGCKGDMSF